jgi:hypothetical protein
MHFQQTMLQMTQSFLSTQQTVMLCYLQNVSSWQRTTPPQHVNGRQLVGVQASIQSTAPDLVNEVASAKVFGFSQHAVIEEHQIGATECVAVPSQENSSPLEDQHATSPPLGDQHATSAQQSDAATECLQEEPLEVNSERLTAALLELISERTGYPSDMIDPSLDLESDLGIDSIKRIEILNKFQTLLPAKRRELLQNSLEELAGARTVNEIMGWITKPETDSSGDEK